MGYLNKTTQVLDAILTTKGRELLAKGDGSFNITKFLPYLKEQEEGSHGFFILMVLVRDIPWLALM